MWLVDHLDWFKLNTKVFLLTIRHVKITGTSIITTQSKITSTTDHSL